MKKIYSLIVFTLFSVWASAQVEFGVQFSPTLSTTRVLTKSEALKFDNYKAGIRFNGGLVLDFFLRDNIALSTGLRYSVKRSGIIPIDSLGGKSNYSVTNTQYLNLPVGFKLFTQEWIPKTKFYIHVGGLADVKIAKDKIKFKGVDIVNPQDFTKIMDISTNVGIGAEMKVGSRNKVFVEVNYIRGLVNMLTNDYNAVINSNNVRLNSDQYGLMIGYKF